MRNQAALALSAYSRANGVQFLACFGVFWLLGSVVLPQHSPDHRISLVNIIALSLGGVLATAVFFGARRTKRSTRAMAKTPANTAPQVRQSRFFRIINAGQYLGFGVAALYLRHLDRNDLLIPGGIFIVGVHFLPLAILFRYPFHLATGLLLIGWSVAYPQWLAAGGWNPLGLSVTGLILLFSASWSHHTAAKLAVASRQA